MPRSLSIGLIALALLSWAMGSAEAQSAQSEARDFTPDRWQLFTTTGQAVAGVRGEDVDEMILFTCTERPRTLSLTIHSTAQGLSNQAYATLAFDGNAKIETELPLMDVFGSILFLLADRDPAFPHVAEKFATADAVEVAVMQDRAVHSRHRFTLKSAAESIAPVMKLCGQ